MELISNNGRDIEQRTWYRTMDLISNNGLDICINIGPLQLKSSEEVLLLGVKLDSQLSFYPHIKNICKKASAKIKALMRIRRYLTQTQVDRLYTAHVMSPLNYCPLVRMFCSKQVHNLIDSTHRRTLCAELNTFTVTLDEMMLEKSNTLSVHTKNLQLLLTEIFKSVNHLNPEFIWDSFIMKPDLYNLRQGSSIVVPRATFHLVLKMKLPCLSSNLKLKSIIFIIDASVVCKYMFC